MVLGDTEITHSFGCDHGIAAQTILLVLAIGKPREKIVAETLKPDGDVKYWRGSGGVHHVPKRRLNDIMLGL